MTKKFRASKTRPDWAKAIEDRRIFLQLPQEIVGENGGMSQSYYSEIERGERELSTLTHTKLLGLARALSWTLGELEKATGVDLGVVTSWTIAGGQSGDDVRISNRVRVPVYALAAAGTGLWTEENFLTYLDVEPEIASRPNRATFEVDGTSMEPTLESGDRIHVDMADKDLRDNKIYVVRLGGNGIVVKRARIYDDGTEHLTSDNPKHPPVRPEEARIIGRVYAVTPKTRRL